MLLEESLVAGLHGGGGSRPEVTEMLAMQQIWMECPIQAWPLLWGSLQISTELLSSLR